VRRGVGARPIPLLCNWCGGHVGRGWSAPIGRYQLDGGVCVGGESSLNAGHTAKLSGKITLRIPSLVRVETTRWPAPWSLWTPAGRVLTDCRGFFPLFYFPRESFFSISWEFFLIRCEVLGHGCRMCTDCKALWGKFVICEMYLQNKLNWIELNWIELLKLPERTLKRHQSRPGHLTSHCSKARA